MNTIVTLNMTCVLTVTCKNVSNGSKWTQKQRNKKKPKKKTKKKKQNKKKKKKKKNLWLFMTIKHFCFHKYFIAMLSKQSGIHNENTPIQIYTGKFHLQKLKIFRKKKTLIFSNFCLKHRLWVLVRTASARRFSRVPHSVFLSRNKKNNVYPCKPHFYYIKVGFKGVNII